MRQRVETARVLCLNYPLRTVCRLLGVGRSSVLYKGAPEPDLSSLKEAIFFFLSARPNAGVRYMYEMLWRHEVECTRKQIYLIYKEEGLLQKPAPPRVQTTDSRHAHPVYPNLIKGIQIDRPDQVWVTDVTFLKVGGNWAYLDLILDVYTRRLLSWSLSASNDTLLCCQALHQALLHGQPEIHHSDQGRPYASQRFTRELEGRGVLISMAMTGSPWQNPHAERVNRTIKEEEVLRSEYRTMSEARQAIGSWVELYNHGRIHSSLGYYTPAEAYEMYEPA